MILGRLAIIIGKAGQLSGLSIHDIRKSFGQTQALRGVSFDVSPAETVAVLGPSGCGKSTVLMIVAGLETPDRGDVLWDGVSLAGVPPHLRGFGLMFQDFALFPHRDVFDNVAFALQIERQPVDQIHRRVEEVLELVGLPGFERRDVNTLSGGEQQRVALARSLAPRPRLLMLDEPLGSLDRNLRERLVIDLREILHGSRQTAIYVTHDQEEAFTLAHRVVVMNAGMVEQIAPPQEIYRHPASVFVARFLGLNNLFPGEIRPGERQADTPIGRLPVSGDLHGKVTVLLRPDEVSLGGEGDCRLQGVLAQSTFRGGVSRAVISVNDIPLTFDFPSSVVLPQPGEPVILTFDAEAVQVFPDTEQVI